MTLPLASAIAGSLAGRWVVGMLLVVAALSLGSARADDQPDPYSATVKVDATAESAAAARTVARTDGQRQALTNVIGQVSGGTADLSKLPKLDDQTITGMVASFEVANEKMSTVRYLADYTFHFRPSRIRQLMRRAGIAVAETPAKPVIVVPIFQDGVNVVLWDDPNPWRDAWGQLPAAAGSLKLSLPLGGIGDLAAIDAEQARSGDAEALSDVAQRNGGDEALVTLATARRKGEQLAGLDVSTKRYRLGQLTDSRTESIDINPGENDSDFLKRAVGVVVADIEHRPPPSPKEASLDATVPIANLGDWVAIQQRLAAVPGIRRVAVLSLSRRQARIEIKYLGSPDQLKSSLAQADLSLDGADPDWRLAPAGATGPN